MLREKLNYKVTLAVVGATLVCAVVGLAGYSSYNRKQVNGIAEHRAWQANRESGIPLSMEAAAGATAEEREQARISALERMHWQGQSEVENTATTPVQ